MSRRDSLACLGALAAAASLATPMTLLAQTSDKTIKFILPVSANNMKELVALFNANPGKYNYASSGNGTILHLAPELFKDVTGTLSTHIPYRGFGPMLQDIVSGQVDWGVGALPAVLGQIKAGNLRVSPAAHCRCPRHSNLYRAGLPRLHGVRLDWHSWLERHEPRFGETPQCRCCGRF